MASHTISQFDDVFQHIGGFGFFQWKLFIVLCCYCFLYSMNYFCQIFLVLTPPHWCSSSARIQDDIFQSFGVNLTRDQLKNLTIPMTIDSKDYEKCLRFDINITEISTFDELQIHDWPKTTCTYGWDYDFSTYYPSITSELNWVCSDDWKPPTAQFIFFFGSLVGGPLFGWLADVFGRIPIIFVVSNIAAIFGIASSFATSFTTFCILRFLVGLIHDSDYMIIYILAMEYVAPKYRSFTGNVPIMIFLTLGMCILPWMAFYIENWKILGIIVALPNFIGIVVPFILPESARWLVNSGKDQKALEIIKKIAKSNNKTLSPEFIEDYKVYSAKERTCNNLQKVNWLHLMKTPTLRKRFIALAIMWVTLFTAYDGFVRLTEKIDMNFFLAFTIMGLIELPADFFTILVMEWLGRRNTTVLSLIITGFSSMTVVFLDKDNLVGILALTFIARFFITMSINVGQQYIIEVLPTVARAQGSGAIHTFGAAASFVVPYIIYMIKYWFWLPYVSFAVICIFGGIVSLSLPETLNEKLPDTLDDGENAFRDQSFIYIPCHKLK